MYNAEARFQVPDDKILSLADYTPSPNLLFNHEATIYVSLYRSLYKRIEDLAEAELRLAGLRVNPKTHNLSRETYFNDAGITHISTGLTQMVNGLPYEGKMSRFVWNHSQTKMSFINTSIVGTELWVIDIDTCVANRITPPIINGAIGTTYLWMKDDLSILVSCMPEDSKSVINKSTIVSSGPNITENNGEMAQVRTYQDLLRDVIDEYNFEAIASSELRLYNLDKTYKLWKGQAIYDDVSLSPNGEYLMVTEILRPYSYLVQYDRFPMTTSLYDKFGNYINTIVSQPLLEVLPQGFMAVMEGRRGLRWRSDHGASVVWIEALDKGDPKLDVPFRDAIVQWKAPFLLGPELIFKTMDRFAGIVWCKEDFALVYEQWWSNRMLRTIFINPSDATASFVLFKERNFQDRYNDPGNFATERNEYGFNILFERNGKMMLVGEGLSEKGKYPFIDEYDIKENSTSRLYEANNKECLETIVSSIDCEAGNFIVRIESPNIYPNYFFRNITNGTLDRITGFENPFESIRHVHKQVIKYQRPDGTLLSASLYLPAGYSKTSRAKLPMIMWAYPAEFKDKDSAGQVTASPNEFTFPFYGSPLYWVNKGYAILDDASMPIIGEGDEEPNDTYIEQLVANAKAAIDAVDGLGYIDRKRVAIGGHSYGAFMTACLLSHCDLFAAGIARSGAFNRSLTPFGFQSEERNLWQAPNVYLSMSPFFNADTMKTPLLIIHGEADNNPGTHTMQSERYFNALKGLGAKVRLVLLPYESHSYLAKENILHMLWEQDQWLEKYLKEGKD